MHRRTAIVTTSWPASEGDPAGHFVRAHARLLQREGDEIVVIAPRAGGAFGWPGAAARIRERPFRTVEAALWMLRAMTQLRRERVDRIVCHWCVPCAWPIGVSAMAPVPRSSEEARASRPLDVVSHGGDVRLLAALPRAVARAIIGRIVACAGWWTFPSTRTARELSALLDDRGRTGLAAIARVNAPPMELPDVSCEIASRRAQGRRFAVCVARLVRSKRVDAAIEYVAQALSAVALERSVSDAGNASRGDGGAAIERLVVVGDGPERRRLEALARRLGVDVVFVGSVDRREALGWIGAADLLIHASKAEGLSTAVREAEALGTPVLTLS